MQRVEKTLQEAFTESSHRPGGMRGVESKSGGPVPLKGGKQHWYYKVPINAIKNGWGKTVNKIYFLNGKRRRKSSDGGSWKKEWREKPTEE